MEELDQITREMDDRADLNLPKVPQDEPIGKDEIKFAKFTKRI